MIRLPQRSTTLVMALTVAMLLAPGLSLARDSKVIRFTVDVAEDFGKFIPTPGDAEPKRGGFFLTEGNVYPAHTILGDGGNFDPNTAGAIGTWVCRGTHLADAADILSEAADIWVATTQNYLFPDDRRSLATEGREGTGKIQRIVIGGTGRFRGYVGEQRQELLGFNATGGVNLRVTFQLRKAD